MSRVNSNSLSPRRTKMDKQDSLTSTQGGEDGETTAQRLSIFWFLLNKFGQPVDTELLNIWKTWFLGDDGTSADGRGSASNRVCSRDQFKRAAYGLDLYFSEEQITKAMTSIADVDGAWSEKVPEIKVAADRVAVGEGAMTGADRQLWGSVFEGGETTPTGYRFTKGKNVYMVVPLTNGSLSEIKEDPNVAFYVVSGITIRGPRRQQVRDKDGVQTAVVWVFNALDWLLEDNKLNVDEIVKNLRSSSDHFTRFDDDDLTLPAEVVPRWQKSLPYTKVVPWEIQWAGAYSRSFSFFRAPGAQWTGDSVPVNIEICLRDGRLNKNLQCGPDNSATCDNLNTLLWEKMTIRSCGDDLYEVVASKNGAKLKRSDEAENVTFGEGEGPETKWNIELAPAGPDEIGAAPRLFFVSPSTGKVMQSTPLDDGSSAVRCVNENRAAWETFHVVWYRAEGDTLTVGPALGNPGAGAEVKQDSNAAQIISNTPVMRCDSGIFYFEVEILEDDPQKACCIGLVPADQWPLRAKQMVGWDRGTIGFHGDDGIVRGEVRKDTGRPFQKGDTVGLLWDRRNTLKFVVNGDIVTDITLSDSQLAMHAYYPCVTTFRGCVFRGNFGGDPAMPFKYEPMNQEYEALKTALRGAPQSALATTPEGTVSRLSPTLTLYQQSEGKTLVISGIDARAGPKQPTATAEEGKDAADEGGQHVRVVRAWYGAASDRWAIAGWYGCDSPQFNLPTVRGVDLTAQVTQLLDEARAASQTQLSLTGADLMKGLGEESSKDPAPGTPKILLVTMSQGPDPRGDAVRLVPDSDICEAVEEDGGARFHIAAFCNFDKHNLYRYRYEEADFRCQGIELTSGRWYYEVELLGAAGSDTAMSSRDVWCGWSCGRRKTLLQVNPFQRKRSSDAGVRSPGESFGADWVPGDVIGCAIDIDAGTLRFSLNGSFAGPDWGRAFTKINFDGGGMRPAISIKASARVRCRFGTYHDCDATRFPAPPGYGPVGLHDLPGVVASADPFRGISGDERRGGRPINRDGPSMIPVAYLPHVGLDGVETCTFAPEAFGGNEVFGTHALVKLVSANGAADTMSLGKVVLHGQRRSSAKAAAPADVTIDFLHFFMWFRDSAQFEKTLTDVEPTYNKWADLIKARILCRKLEKLMRRVGDQMPLPEVRHRLQISVGKRVDQPKMKINFGFDGGLRTRKELEDMNLPQGKTFAIYAMLPIRSDGAGKKLFEAGQLATCIQTFWAEAVEKQTRWENLNLRLKLHIGLCKNKHNVVIALVSDEAPFQNREEITPGVIRQVFRILWNILEAPSGANSASSASPAQRHGTTPAAVRHGAEAGSSELRGEEESKSASSMPAPPPMDQAGHDRLPNGTSVELAFTMDADDLKDEENSIPLIQRFGAKFTAIADGNLRAILTMINFVQTMDLIDPASSQRSKFISLKKDSIKAAMKASTERADEEAPKDGNECTQAYAGEQLQEQISDIVRARLALFKSLAEKALAEKGDKTYAYLAYDPSEWEQQKKSNPLLDPVTVHWDSDKCSMYDIGQLKNPEVLMNKLKKVLSIGEEEGDQHELMQKAAKVLPWVVTGLDTLTEDLRSAKADDGLAEQKEVDESPFQLADGEIEAHIDRLEGELSQTRTAMQSASNSEGELAYRTKATNCMFELALYQLLVDKKREADQAKWKDTLRLYDLGAKFLAHQGHTFLRRVAQDVEQDATSFAQRVQWQDTIIRLFKATSGLEQDSGDTPSGAANDDDAADSGPSRDKIRRLADDLRDKIRDFVQGEKVEYDRVMRSNAAMVEEACKQDLESADVFLKTLVSKLREPVQKCALYPLRDVNVSFKFDDLAELLQSAWRFGQDQSTTPDNPTGEFRSRGYRDNQFVALLHQGTFMETLKKLTSKRLNMLRTAGSIAMTRMWKQMLEGMERSAGGAPNKSVLPESLEAIGNVKLKKGTLLSQEDPSNQVRFIDDLVRLTRSTIMGVSEIGVAGLDASFRIRTENMDLVGLLPELLPDAAMPPEGTDPTASWDTELQEFLGGIQSGFRKYGPSSEEKEAEARRRLLKSNFSLFDKDQSNYLDREELKALMVVYGETLDDRQVTELFKQVDTDNNNQISFEEFEKWVSREDRQRGDDVSPRVAYQLLSTVLERELDEVSKETSGGPAGAGGQGGDRPGSAAIGARGAGGAELRCNWVKHRTKANPPQDYYYNEESGESVWHEPQEYKEYHAELARRAAEIGAERAVDKAAAAFNSSTRELHDNNTVRGMIEPDFRTGLFNVFNSNFQKPRMSIAFQDADRTDDHVLSEVHKIMSTEDAAIIKQHGPVPAAFYFVLHIQSQKMSKDDDDDDDEEAAVSTAGEVAGFLSDLIEQWLLDPNHESGAQIRETLKEMDLKAKLEPGTTRVKYRLRQIKSQRFDETGRRAVLGVIWITSHLNRVLRSNAIWNDEAQCFDYGDHEKELQDQMLDLVRKVISATDFMWKLQFGFNFDDLFGSEDDVKLKDLFSARLTCHATAEQVGLNLLRALLRKMPRNPRGYGADPRDFFLSVANMFQVFGSAVNLELATVEQLVHSFFADKVITTEGDEFNVERVMKMFGEARCSDLGALLSYLIKWGWKIMTCEMPESAPLYKLFDPENIAKYAMLFEHARGIENIGITGDWLGKDGLEFHFKGFSIIEHWPITKEYLLSLRSLRRGKGDGNKKSRDAFQTQLDEEFKASSPKAYEWLTLFKNLDSATEQSKVQKMVSDNFDDFLSKFFFCYSSARRLWVVKPGQAITTDRAKSEEIAKWAAGETKAEVSYQLVDKLFTSTPELRRAWMKRLLAESVVIQQILIPIEHKLDSTAVVLEETEDDATYEWDSAHDSAAQPHEWERQTPDPGKGYMMPQPHGEALSLTCGGGDAGVYTTLKAHGFVPGDRIRATFSQNNGMVAFKVGGVLSPTQFSVTLLGSSERTTMSKVDHYGCHWNDVENVQACRGLRLILKDEASETDQKKGKHQVKWYTRTSEAPDDDVLEAQGFADGSTQAARPLFDDDQPVTSLEVVDKNIWEIMPYRGCNLLDQNGRKVPVLWTSVEAGNRRLRGIRAWCAKHGVEIRRPNLWNAQSGRRDQQEAKSGVGFEEDIERDRGLIPEWSDEAFSENPEVVARWLLNLVPEWESIIGMSGAEEVWVARQIQLITGYLQDKQIYNLVQEPIALIAYLDAERKKYYGRQSTDKFDTVTDAMRKWQDDMLMRLVGDKVDKFLEDKKCSEYLMNGDFYSLRAALGFQFLADVQRSKLKSEGVSFDDDEHLSATALERSLAYMVSALDRSHISEDMLKKEAERFSRARQYLRSVIANSMNARRRSQPTAGDVIQFNKSLPKSQSHKSGDALTMQEAEEMSRFPMFSAASALRRFLLGDDGFGGATSGGRSGASGSGDTASGRSPEDTTRAAAVWRFLDVLDAALDASLNVREVTDVHGGAISVLVPFDTDSSSAGSNSAGAPRVLIEKLSDLLGSNFMRGRDEEFFDAETRWLDIVSEHTIGTFTVAVDMVHSRGVKKGLETVLEKLHQHLIRVRNLPPTAPRLVSMTVARVNRVHWYFANGARGGATSSLSGMVFEDARQNLWCGLLGVIPKLEGSDQDKSPDGTFTLVGDEHIVKVRLYHESSEAHLSAGKIKGIAMDTSGQRSFLAGKKTTTEPEEICSESETKPAILALKAKPFRATCDRCESVLPGEHSPAYGYGCDVCRSTIGKGDFKYGCRNCNWDMCGNCFKSRAAQAPPVPADNEQPPIFELTARQIEADFGYEAQFADEKKDLYVLLRNEKKRLEDAADRLLSNAMIEPNAYLPSLLGDMWRASVEVDTEAQKGYCPSEPSAAVGCHLNACLEEYPKATHDELRGEVLDPESETCRDFVLHLVGHELAVQLSSAAVRIAQEGSPHEPVNDDELDRILHTVFPSGSTLESRQDANHASPGLMRSSTRINLPGSVAPRPSILSIPQHELLLDDESGNDEELKVGEGPILPAQAGAIMPAPAAPAAPAAPSNIAGVDAKGLVAGAVPVVHAARPKGGFKGVRGMLAPSAAVHPEPGPAVLPLPEPATAASTSQATSAIGGDTESKVAFATGSGKSAATSSDSAAGGESKSGGDGSAAEAKKRGAFVRGLWETRARLTFQYSKLEAEELALLVDDKLQTGASFPLVSPAASGFDELMSTDSLAGYVGYLEEEGQAQLLEAFKIDDPATYSRSAGELDRLGPPDWYKKAHARNWELRQRLAASVKVPAHQGPASYHGPIASTARDAVRMRTVEALAQFLRRPLVRVLIEGRDFVRLRSAIRLFSFHYVKRLVGGGHVKSGITPTVLRAAAPIIAYEWVPVKNTKEADDLDDKESDHWFASSALDVLSSSHGRIPANNESPDELSYNYGEQGAAAARRALAANRMMGSSRQEQHRSNKKLASNRGLSAKDLTLMEFKSRQYQRMCSQEEAVNINRGVLGDLRVPREAVTLMRGHGRTGLLSELKTPTSKNISLKDVVLFTILSSQNPNATFENYGKSKLFPGSKFTVDGGPVLVGLDPISGTLIMPYSRCFVPADESAHCFVNGPKHIQRRAAGRLKQGPEPQLLLNFEMAVHLGIDVNGRIMRTGEGGKTGAQSKGLSGADDATALHELMLHFNALPHGRSNTDESAAANHRRMRVLKAIQRLVDSGVYLHDQVVEDELVKAVHGEYGNDAGGRLWKVLVGGGLVTTRVVEVMAFSDDLGLTNDDALESLSQGVLLSPCSVRAAVLVVNAMCRLMNNPATRDNERYRELALLFEQFAAEQLQEMEDTAPDIRRKEEFVAKTMDRSVDICGEKMSVVDTIYNVHSTSASLGTKFVSYPVVRTRFSQQWSGYKGEFEGDFLKLEDLMGTHVAQRRGAQLVSQVLGPKMTDIASFSFYAFAYGRLVDTPCGAWIYEFNTYLVYLILYILVVATGIEDLQKRGLAFDGNAEGDRHKTFKVFFLLMTFAYIVFEGKEIVGGGSFKNYLKDVWNKVEMAAYFFFLVWFFTEIAVMRLDGAMYSFIPSTPDSDRVGFNSARPIYTEVAEVGKWSFAFGGFCIILKILPLLVLNETFGPLVRSVIKMLDKFAGFFMVLIVFVIAFAVIFLQRFGGKVEGYENILEAFFSSFFLLIGDFEIHPESEKFTTTDRYMWQGMVIAHLCIGNVLLLNLLIAVLSTAYEDVNEQATEEWQFLKLNMIKHGEDAACPPPVNLLVLVFETIGRFPGLRALKGVAAFLNVAYYTFVVRFVFLLMYLVLQVFAILPLPMVLYGALTKSTTDGAADGAVVEHQPSLAQRIRKHTIDELGAFKRMFDTFQKSRKDTQQENEEMEGVGRLEYRAYRIGLCYARKRIVLVCGSDEANASLNAPVIVTEAKAIVDAADMYLGGITEEEGMVALEKLLSAIDVAVLRRYDRVLNHAGRSMAFNARDDNQRARILAERGPEAVARYDQIIERFRQGFTALENCDTFLNEFTIPGIRDKDAVNGVLSSNVSKKNNGSVLGAHNSSYICCSGNNPRGTDGQAAFGFEVSGEMTVHFRIKLRVASSASMFRSSSSSCTLRVQVDDGDIKEWNVPSSKEWAWRGPGRILAFTVSKGPHALKLYLPSGGMDRIEVSTIRLNASPRRDGAVVAWKQHILKVKLPQRDFWRRLKTALEARNIAADETSVDDVMEQNKESLYEIKKQLRKEVASLEQRMQSRMRELEAGADSATPADANPQGTNAPPSASLN